MAGLKAEQLRIFCAVAKHRSVTRAAHILGLSQPAVSRQLLQLQSAVGQALYVRTASGIELTPYGEQLLAHACAVSDSLQRAQEFLLGEQHSEQITVRLGLSHHLVGTFTGRILKRAKDAISQGGNLQVHFAEGYSRPLMTDVSRRVLDAALVFGAETMLPETLVSQRMAEEALALLVKPDDPLAADMYAPSHVLEGETLILPASVSWIYRRVRDYLASIGVTPGRLIEVSGPYAVRCAVLDGLGIGVTVRSFVQQEVDLNLLRTVNLEAVGFIAGIYAVTRPPEAYTLASRQALEHLLHLKATPSARPAWSTVASF